MSKFIAMLTVLVALVATVSAQDLEIAKFQIQNHDITVEVMKPRLAAISQHWGRPVVTGVVTIVIHNQMEIVSVQSNWNGEEGDGSRFSYTLVYRLKGVTVGEAHLTSYSLSLFKFSSTSKDCVDDLWITPMGVVPEDDIVRFRSAEVGEDIHNGTNPRKFLKK
jgi:hypothetical protein